MWPWWNVNNYIYLSIVHVLKYKFKILIHVVFPFDATLQLHSSSSHSKYCTFLLHFIFMTHLVANYFHIAIFHTLPVYWKHLDSDWFGDMKVIFVVNQKFMGYVLRKVSYFLTFRSLPEKYKTQNWTQGLIFTGQQRYKQWKQWNNPTAHNLVKISSHPQQCNTPYTLIEL